MSNQFKSVYTNDPANMVAEAFAELYPDAKYEAALAPELYDDKGTPICSCITFPNEGDDADAVPIIVVNSQLGVEIAAAELAMQLIHAALGFESLKGGEAYDAALNALKVRYNEIGNERFHESAEAAEPVGGGGNE